MPCLRRASIVGFKGGVEFQPQTSCMTECIVWEDTQVAHLLGRAGCSFFVAAHFPIVSFQLIHVDHLLPHLLCLSVTGEQGGLTSPPLPLVQQAARGPPRLSYLLLVCAG